VDVSLMGMANDVTATMMEDALPMVTHRFVNGRLSRRGRCRRRVRR